MILTDTQVNGTEQRREPRNKPTITWSIYDKGGKKNTMGKKDSLFNKWCGKTGHPHAKE